MKRFLSDEQILSFPRETLIYLQPTEKPAFHGATAATNCGALITVLSVT